MVTEFNFIFGDISKSFKMTEHKPFNYYHITPIQIRFNDIDQLGHVTNSVYQQYLDLGKMSYFNDVLKELMDWEIEGLILASISIDYINPIKLNDKVVVRTKIYSIGNKSLKMSQEIFDESTGKIIASSKATMVAYSNKNESTIMVPERWRRSIIAFERDVLFKV
jgi:acyl-CoA thioester hydrolase